MPIDTQLAIAEDETFRRRLKQALIQVAIAIFNEAPSTPLHDARLALAKQILGDGADSHVTRLAHIIPTIASVESAGREVNDATLLNALEAIINPYTQVV